MKFLLNKKPISDNHDALRGIYATRDAYNFNLENWDEILDNTDKVLREQGITLRDLERLTYDAHLSSCMQSRKDGVLSLEWEITESTNIQINEILKKAFSLLDMRTIIEEMLDAPFYGYAPCEIYWDIYDNYLLPYSIVSKPPIWFKYDKYNLLRFMRQDTAEGVICPPMKFLVVKYQAKYDKPYGTPLLAKCFYPVMFKKQNIKLWNIFNEKYGMPGLVAKSSLMKIDQLLMDALQKFRADSITVVPDGTDINLMQASSASGDNYNQLIDFLNREISKLILSQTLSTEQGATGSLALGQAHLEVRESVVMSDKSLIEGAFNKLIKWIINVNIGSVAEYPKFVMYKSTDVDKNLADRDKILWDMGLRMKSEYFQVAYGLKENEFEIIDVAKPADNSPQNSFKFNDNDEDFTEVIPEMTLDDFTKANDKMIKPVLKMINDAKSYEEIQSELVNMFPELDTDSIEELIGKGILIANVSAVLDKKKGK